MIVGIFNGDGGTSTSTLKEDYAMQNTKEQFLF